MTGQENIKVVRNIYDSYNRRDFDSALKNIDKNVEIVNVALNTTLRGPDGFRQFMQGWETAFPDSKVDVKNIFASEDFVVVEFTGKGTHKGVLWTPDGELPATGKPLNLNFCDIHTVKDGKITRMKSYYDLATILHQIGYMPELRHH